MTLRKMVLATTLSGLLAVTGFSGTAGAATKSSRKPAATRPHCVRRNGHLVCRRARRRSSSAKKATTTTTRK